MATEADPAGTTDGIAVRTTDTGVRVVTFCRPQRRNAMDAAMFAAYYAALAAADDDPAVRAIVITGAGDWFCTGADFETLGGLLDRPAAERSPATAQFPPHLPLTLRTPLIAAVNGGAAGLGLVHALYADVRFVAAEARLATSFSRLGLVAEYGSAWLLPRLVGAGNALDLLLSGRKFDAAEALRIGLAQRVLPRADLLAAALAYAEDLAAHCSPASMAAIRAQVRDAAHLTAEEAVADSMTRMWRSFDGADFLAAMTARAQGVPPFFGPAAGRPA
ncbi:enoyl-CoA hydratase-related protein [Micromonosporaceae bacterium DT55]|uniref:enoyl-CoA hydratase-related protein n=1 Tax=Melissospora conviva TaxID=3388432 RepID=UPI003C2090AD